MFCLFKQFTIGKPMFSYNVVSSIQASVNSYIVFKKVLLLGAYNTIKRENQRYIVSQYG